MINKVSKHHNDKVSDKQLNFSNYDINREIGLRIKRFRKISSMTQTQLGNAIGVSFQQIQKYENGTNNIAFHRLIDLCKVLNIGIDDILNNVITISNDNNESLNNNYQLSNIKGNISNTATKNYNIIKKYKKLTPQLQDCLKTLINAL